MGLKMEYWFLIPYFLKAKWYGEKGDPHIVELCIFERRIID